MDKDLDAELSSARQLHRQSRWLPALDTILQDLRYTFRTLRRDAGFTTFAILIVGLGIGASSTVFSVVNGLLLRALPFHEPERLVWVANRDLRRDFIFGQPAHPGDWDSHGPGRICQGLTGTNRDADAGACRDGNGAGNRGVAGPRADA